MVYSPSALCSLNLTMKNECYCYTVVVIVVRNGDHKNWKQTTVFQDYVPVRHETNVARGTSHEQVSYRR